MKKIFLNLKRSLTLMLLLVSTIGAFGQAVSTNSSSGLAATYADLAAAITALNAATITAPVTITLETGNPQTAPAGGYNITATGTSINTITITGAGTGSTITASSSHTAGSRVDAIFKIVGGDYITVQSFDMKESANSTTTLASNNLTEFGVALFYASATNGAQNVTIQNNTIALKANYQNAIGIYSNTTHTATVPGTAANASSNAGLNSNLKIYGNTISSVNYGIVYICPANTASITETGFDVGGTSNTTGNSITYGTNTVADAAWNGFSSTITGIGYRNGVNANIRYNTLTTNASLTVALNGIAISGTAPTSVTYTNTINNNTVTLTQTGTTATTGIDFGYGISTGTMVASNNKVTISQTAGSASSSAITGIRANYTGATITATYDTISISQSNTSASGAFSGAVTGISAGAVTNATLSNNIITMTQTISSAGTFSGAVVGISPTGIISGTGDISSNQFKNWSYRSSSTSSGFIYCGAANTGTITVQGNITSGASTPYITRLGSVAGTLYGYYNNSSAASGTTNIYDNNFSEIQLSGSLSFTGIYELNGGSGQTKAVYNNTINNISGGTSGTVIGITAGYAATCNVYNNTVTNISSVGVITGISNSGSTAGSCYGNTVTGLSSTSTGGAVTGIGSAGTTISTYSNTINTLSSTSTTATVAGISSSATTSNIYSNTINTLSCVGTTSGVANGIMVTGGTSVSVYKNKIRDVLLSGASSTVGAVNGIVLSGTTASVTANVYNNVIGDLRATTSTSSDAIRGISVTATGTTSTYRIYFNSIHLNASSSGGTFGTSGIYHAASATSTTATLDLRNNMIVNLSTAAGTGVTTAYRRSGTNLGNYSTSSNRNAFIASSIMNDGTTNYTNMSAYKTAMSTRDANSFTTEGGFNYATDGSFFISTTASSTDFLKIADGTTSQAESGGVAITTPSITDDYAGTTRGSTPDIGAFEFTGVTPAPAFANLAATPALTTQCSATGRNISLDITTAGGSITSATLNYSYNGVAQTGITMTNTGGNTWSGTIPAPTSPTNATVSWSVIATNSIGISNTYTGTSYSDEPLYGATATATATPSTVCVGGSTSVNAVFAKPGGTATVGSGVSTSSSSTTPFSGTYGGMKGQYLILASELTAAGLTAGNITALALDISSAGATTYQGFSIQLGTTSLSAFPGTLSLESSGFVTVYNPANFTPTTGVNTFTLSTPFSWDGTSNIIVSTNWSNNTTTSTTSTVKVVTTVFNSAQIHKRDSYTPAALLALTGTQSGGSSTVGTTRPHIIFTGVTIQAATAYSWSDGSTTVGSTQTITPTVSSNTTYTCTVTAAGCTITSNGAAVTANPLPTAPTATNSNQCGTAVPTASVADPNGFTTPTFKWYDAASAGIMLQSSTSTTYTSTVAATTTFYVSVINPTTGCESARTAVTVTVTAAPALTVTANQGACNNEIITLAVTSTTADYDVYNWTPTTNLFTDAAATTAYDGTGNPTTVYFKSATAGAATITLNANNTGSGCTNITTTTVTVLPASITASAANSNFCVSGSTSVSVPSIPTGGTLQWQDSDNGTDWADIASANSASYTTPTLTATKYYRAVLKKNGTTNCINSNTLTLTVNTPSVGTVNNGTRCGIGTVDLSVSGNNGTVKWYAAASGGTVLTTGTSYTTPSISTTTTYYVEATSGTGAPQSVARVSPASTASDYWSNYGLVFNATSDIQLNSVKVYPVNTTPANMTIRLYDNAGVQVSGTSDVVFMPISASGSTAQTVALNYTIPAGTGYRLVIISGMSTANKLVQETTGITYPITNGAVSVTATATGLTTTSSTYYNWFYDWNITPICATSRQAVTATVTTPPSITPTANFARCANDAASAITVSSSNDPNYTYTWSPSTGLSATTGASITANPSTTTTYTVTATDASGGANNGCVTTGTVAVTVNANPNTPTVTPASTTMCSNGAAVQLTASGSAANGTATIGTGTSTTAAATTSNTYMPNVYGNYYGGTKVQSLILASELTAANLIAGSSISSIAFEVGTAGSNTLNSFKVKVGHSSLTALSGNFQTGLTEVYSGTISSQVTGFGTVITFSTPFVWDGTSNLIVETSYSNNDGGNGSTTQTMKVTSTAFASTQSYRVDDNAPSAVETATTPTYTESERPNIRFAYTNPVNYTWSSTTGLYTDAGATAAYAGAASASVYAKPSSTTTYTATATNAAGCTATNTATVTVDQAPTTADAGTAQSAASTTFTLAGNTPSVGTGAWSVVSGDAAIANAASNTSAVTMPVGVATLRWIISNGVCTPSTADVTLTSTAGLGSATTTNACQPFATVTIGASNNNVWVPLLDGGNIVAAIKANGNNLGTVSGSYFINGTGSVRTAGTTGAAYLDRNVGITVQNAPASNVDVRVYISAAEWAALQTAVPTLADNNFSLNRLAGTCNTAFPIGEASVINGATISDINGYRAIQFATNQFSDFFITGKDVVLPIELKSLTAAAQAEVNIVKWVTSSEKNVSEFIVERSANGRTGWATVATVKAFGNSQVENAYTATDATPLSMSYYRLRTTDNNGKEQISNVVSVARKVGRLNITKVYPVPTSDNLNVQFEAKADETVSIEVTNVLGQVVMQRSFAAKTGFNALEIDMTVLKTGAYILSLNNGKEAVTQRIIKQ